MTQADPKHPSHARAVCCSPRGNAIQTRARVATALLVLLALAWPGLAQGGGTDAEPTADAVPAPTVTQPVFPVSVFEIAFDREINSEKLSAKKLLNQPLRLAKVEGVYTRPQPGTATIVTTLASLSGESAQRYDVTALRAIIDDTLAYLNEEAELVGIVVAPDPRDIGLDLSDRREGRTNLRILIRAATVGRVRTLASGDRIAPEDRENNALHERIRERSPLKAGDAPREGSLLERDALDAYLYRLNRHPGRRVDAAISPGLQPGEVTLDYLVAENKPWYAYFQLSNTGTDSTNELRERFGFVHNQLTHHDDTLSIDYITAGFDDSHVVAIGYDRPLTERWELRIDALWSEFTADQVGSPLAFTGEDVSFGGALAFNFYQDDALFLDAVGGLEYYFTSARNPGAGTDGEESLLLGTVGLELERVTDLSQTRGELKVRGNLNQASGDEYAALGRTAPDTSFLVLQYGLTTSFYLEPLLNRAAWEDITDPETSTLAHEVALAMRGQWAVDDDRLAPTFQAVAGGLNTVRGYEQAEVAGDSSVILTAEYRFHVPRVFGIEAPRRTAIFDRPFRVAPESVYGRPDWDLVLKTFVDYAFIDTSNELAFETDDTLLSTGVGFELALKNNVNFRGEWGFALQDAGGTDAGDSRFHFSLTLLY
ncbi:MAG: hypothetical protein ACE37H_18430 [Phycisphaeraceae bacterium]